MTIRKLLQKTIGDFESAGIKEAQSDAKILLFEAFGINMTDFFLRGNEEAKEGSAGIFQGFVQRRLKGIPVQYIINKAWFYGREFWVNEDVLIPRFDTEVLVEKALKHIDRETRVLDVCTGSGCIITTICAEKGCVGCAVDISEKALEVAGKNAEKYGMADQIRFTKSNMFEKVEGEFDVIVSNPPYIRTGEIGALDCEVKENEPLLALDGGEDGLDFYRILAQKSPEYLSKKGCVFFEIGFDEGEAVTKLLQKDFTDIEVIKDLSGLDRVVFGRIKNV